MIEYELPRHVGQPIRQHATHELVLRQLLLQEAARLGLEGQDDDERINQAIQVSIPALQVSEADCQAWYDAHPEAFATRNRWRPGIFCSSRWITPPLSLLRAKAEGILAEIQANLARFAELAQEHSACPSRAEGGELGMLARSQTVPI